MVNKEEFKDLEQFLDNVADDNLSRRDLITLRGSDSDIAKTASVLLDGVESDVYKSYVEVDQQSVKNLLNDIADDNISRRELTELSNVDSDVGKTASVILDGVESDVYKSYVEVDQQSVKNLLNDIADDNISRRELTELSNVDSDVGKTASVILDGVESDVYKSYVEVDQQSVKNLLNDIADDNISRRELTELSNVDSDVGKTASVLLDGVESSVFTEYIEGKLRNN